jgi:hypothetical protein
MASRAGSPNKNKAFLLNKLKEMYGEQFDPIMRAAALANRIDGFIEKRDAEIKEIKDPEQKIEAEQKSVLLILSAIDKWLKVGEFTNGKVQAITLSQDPENPVFGLVDYKMPATEATKAYRDSLKASAKPH